MSTRGRDTTPGASKSCTQRNRPFLVSVNRLHGKCRQADGDVLSSIGTGSGILNPLSSVGHYALSSFDFECTAFVSHEYSPFQHNGELVELRSLAGLEPSLRAAHVGNACGGGL